MNKKGMGVHLLLNLYGCPREKLEDVNSISKIFSDVIKKAGLSCVSEPKFHQFEPVGVTGFVLLAESHLSVHTWPEHNSAAVDIFCCYLNEKGKEMACKKAESAADAVIENFMPGEFEKKMVSR